MLPKGKPIVTKGTKCYKKVKRMLRKGKSLLQKGLPNVTKSTPCYKKDFGCPFCNIGSYKKDMIMLQTGTFT